MFSRTSVECSVLLEVTRFGREHVVLNRNVFSGEDRGCGEEPISKEEHII